MAVTRKPKAVEWSELWPGGGDRTGVVGKRPFAWQVDPAYGPPAILALDVAARSGWCAIGVSGRHLAGTLPHVEGVNEKWCRALDDVLRTFVGLVLIETGSPGFAGRLPIPALAVERYVGAALGLCALRGLPAVRVMASTWQTAILGRHRRAAGKALAMAVAKKHFGDSAITTEDVADAACLALWGRGGKL
jgi:hypothetical protein